MVKVFRFITGNIVFQFWVVVAVTILISLQQYHFRPDRLENLAIFRFSFFNLIHHKNIYMGGQYYETVPIDMYKYSPSFAILMAPLAVIPVLASVLLWNFLNTLTFFFAVKSLPFSNEKKCIVIWIGLLEMVICLQNLQSNLLMAGLMIFAFTNLENKRPLWAALCIVFSVYIKLFGAVAFLFFLFYPQKVKFVLYSLMWSVIIFLLPLLAVSHFELADLYNKWFDLLKHDGEIAWGLSAMAIARAWTGLNIDKVWFQLAGVILLIIPLIKFKEYTNTTFRMLYLASVLLWVVVFNHRSESPSFIIAMAGIGIWFITEKASTMNIVLVVLAVFITSFAHSDIFPLSFIVNVVDPYIIKGAPAFLLWILVQYKLYKTAFKPQPAMVQAGNSIGGSQK